MGNTNQPAGGFPGELNEAALKRWPMRFHTVHSENIGLSPDKRRARRLESFCMGICFGERPVLINERIYLKFSEISLSWSGVIRFGFSANNPVSVNPAELPRYACPDLTNQPGYWAKALPERYAEQGNVLFFYLTRSGDVMFGLNDEEKGMFFNGVDVSCPLWPLVDIYGNTTSMEFVDGKQTNNITASSSVLKQTDIAQGLANLSLSGAQAAAAANSPSNQNKTSSSSLHSAQSMPTLPTGIASTSHLPINHYAQYIFTPMAFHQSLTGRHVGLSFDCLTAVRMAGEYCNAYVFTHRPLLCGECLVIQVLAADTDFHGGLAFGMTACDPATIASQELPDDSDLLLDRPEYWVVNKDVYSPAEVGDELSFHLTESGELKYCKNRHPVGTLMFVDKTLPLWAFFDVYGSTQKIRSLGIVSGQIHSSASRTTSSRGTDHRTSVAGAKSSGGAGLTVALPPPRSQSPLATSNTSGGIRPPPRPPLPQSGSGAAAALGTSDFGGGIVGRTSKPLPPPQPAQTSHGVPLPPPTQPKQSVKKQPVNIIDMDVATPPRLPPKQMHHHSGQRPVPPQLPPFDQILTPTPVKTYKPPVPVRSVFTVPPPSQPQQGGEDSASTGSTPNPSNPPILPRSDTTVTTTPQTITTNTSKSTSTTTPVTPTATTRSAPSSSTTSPAHAAAKTKDGGSGDNLDGFTKSEPLNDDSSESGSTTNECAVCFERAVDCVIYTCGHMCCCYTCAMDICQNQGRLCPICRVYITDIIRIYRS